jgi:Ca2+-binding RTX toxin-like protein
MITAHSLRKAPPTVAEQLATKDVAPNNKKTVLIMLGIAAVLAYARSFFGEGPAFAGLPPAAPGSDAQQSATDTGFGTSDALRNAESDGAGDEATDEASGPSPVSDVLPVADSAFFFELLRSSGGFEIGAASSAALGLDDQLAALEPMAYRESNQSQSRFAFQPVSLPVSGSTASSDIPPVRVPLDTAGQDLSGPTGNTGGTGGTTGGSEAGAGSGTAGSTDTGTGTGGSGSGAGTGGTDAGVTPGGGTNAAGTPGLATQSARMGTGLADMQTGTLGSDQVFGLGGNDNIDAGDGDDYVDGGLGDDLIAGRNGTDTLLGAEGDDVLDGGAGDDILYGQDGDDRLFGMQGDDILFGGAAADALFGGIGADALSGGDGADILAGDEGDDMLDGQAGDDRLFDGLGSDVVSGGLGDDWVSAANDADQDSFFGNAGVDVLDLSSFDTGLTINLADMTVASGSVLDQFAGFEQILGGAGNDVFQAGSDGMSLAGGAGSDVFDFSLVPGMATGQTMSFFRITDFQAGDTLKLPGNLTLASLSGTPGLFGLTQPEPSLATMMGQGQDYTQDNGPARLRFATDASDSLVHTVITADVDNDGAWDFEVSIDGWVPSDAVPQNFHLTQPLQQ